MKIVITGANGFVGRTLCEQLNKEGHLLTRAVRQNPSANEVMLGNLESCRDLQSLLQGCNAVVHLAARVHVMHDTASDPLTEFRKVNTAGTLHLAREAARAGVRRFVFLSSIKVNGEMGVFSETNSPSPQDPYGVSKWEAEEGLHTIATETGLEVVILRSPLVYGVGVGANFLRLMRTVDRGVPLPFGLIDNRRSLIYLENLVAAISICLTHPIAKGQTYLVSDGEAISTSQLVRRISNALECSARLLPVPPVLIKLAGSVFRKKQEVDRLLGSLVIDSSAICNNLAWQPPFTMQEGLKKTAQWYRGIKTSPDLNRD